MQKEERAKNRIRVLQFPPNSTAQLVGYITISATHLNELLIESFRQTPYSPSSTYFFFFFPCLHSFLFLPSFPAPCFLPHLFLSVSSTLLWVSLSSHWMYFLIVLNVSPVLLGSMFLFYFLTGVLGLLKKKILPWGWIWWNILLGCLSAECRSKGCAFPFSFLNLVEFARKCSLRATLFACIY